MIKITPKVKPTKRDDLTKVIQYKGGTITMNHTNADWRNLCEIHKGILCWFNTNGYLEQRIILNSLPSCNPIQTLNYIRNRIKNSPRRPV